MILLPLAEKCSKISGKVRKLTKEIQAELANCPCTGVNLPKLLQLALLFRIAQEPSHGYAIMQKLSASGLFGTPGI